MREPANRGKPVIVIGLDGGTWRLIDKWIEMGELPTFERIKSRSAWGYLESCLPPVTSPNWKCYSTGKNPGNLGVYWWEIIDVANRNITIPDATSYNSAELWDYLGDTGHNWAVVNMPTTFPPHGGNNFGIMIAGNGASPDQEYTSPNYLKSTIEKRFDYTPVPEISIDEEGAIEEIYELIDKRFEVAQWLLETRNLDFLHLTIFLNNKLQHFFWDGEETLGGWKRIDKNLQYFVDRDYDMVFMSDHGSNEITTDFYINTWLEREGYLTRTESSKTVDSIGTKMGLTPRQLSDVTARLGIRDILRKIVPQSVIDRLPQKGYKKTRKFDPIDWEKTKAVGSGQGLIYLTEPNTPGAEETREEIINSLSEITDPRTGTPIAKEIYRQEDIYHGDYTDTAPDIIYDQSPGIHTEDLVGEYDVFTEPSGWRGANEREGIFMAYGPSFEACDELSRIKITDIMPTILHLCGVPIPNDIDGNIVDVFADGANVDADDVTYQSPRDPPVKSKERLKDPEDRLRELGYLG